MPLDFSKIPAIDTADTLLSPREIFAALPGKQAKYNYLRDVQAEVLSQWNENRESSDVRLKMNTGGGKTLVGLLILKSRLNEKKGPAVYVAATPYLASQVIQEANALGIAVEHDPRALTVAMLARRLRIHPLTLQWKILLWWKQGPGSSAVDLDRPSLRLAFRRDERILRLHELGYLDAVAQMAGEADPKTELGQWILLRLLDAGVLRAAFDIVEQQGKVAGAPTV